MTDDKYKQLIQEHAQRIVDNEEYKVENATDNVLAEVNNPQGYTSYNPLTVERDLSHAFITILYPTRPDKQQAARRNNLVRAIQDIQRHGDPMDMLAECLRNNGLVIREINGCLQILLMQTY